MSKPATLVLTLSLILSLPVAPGQDKKVDNKYIGADQCKKCHDAKSKGAQVATWKETKHAKTFGLLATDAAKKIAKDKGIDDPQKSEKCLKCHVTAFGEPPERLGKNFDPKLGVQCEACHGPGEKHMKARLSSEDEGDGRLEIPDGEIVKSPPLKTCLGCHNEESPNFKPFCLKQRFEKIAHFDPRKKRTEEDLKAMKCGCTGEKKCDCCKGCTCEGCAKGSGCSCKQGECGELHPPKK